MDKDITGVFVGVLASCFICVIVLNQNSPAKECVATIKDKYGYKHEIVGVVR